MGQNALGSITHGPSLAQLAPYVGQRDNLALHLVSFDAG